MKLNWYSVRFQDDETMFIVKAIGAVAAIAKARDHCIKAGCNPDGLPLHNWGCEAVDKMCIEVLE
jgi:hypothetical protein